MRKPLDYCTVTIPAGSAANPCAITKQTPGAFFLCRAASAPFLMQFDSGTQFLCEAGFQTGGGAVGAFRTITFFNPNAYSITVRYYVGIEGVGFSGSILAQNLPTYLLGNLGLANAADLATGVYTAGGESQTITFSTYNHLRVTTATDIRVYGVNNGNTRKAILIRNAQTGGTLVIKTAAGSTFQPVRLDTTMIFETADTLVLRGEGGTASIIIGEIYYAS